MADRVYLEKFKGKKLTPSLYTFLIAPSARGKGIACDTILDYLGDIPAVNVFAGSTTAERCMEMMSNTRRKKREGGSDENKGKIFIVMEELALCIGGAPQANSFIKFMTGFYKRDSKVPWRKETVAGATASISAGCVNWLCGSTQEWLIEALPPSTIESGFAGRIACVFIPKAMPKIRVFRPESPPDYAEVRDHLHMRFEKLSQMRGEFQRTRKALRLEEHWYMTRPDPTDERLEPTWKRQHDLLLKMSMVLSMCDSEDGWIRGHHMAGAQKLVASSYKASQYLLAAASITPETKKLEQVRELVRAAGALQIPSLIRMARSRGVSHYEVTASVEAMKAAHDVDMMRVNKRLVVVWRNQKRRK